MTSKKTAFNSPRISQKDIHADVKPLAGEKPAIVFSKEAFRLLFLTSIHETGAKIGKMTFPIEGQPDVSVTYMNLSVDTRDFDVDVREHNGEIQCDIIPNFELSLMVHPTNNVNESFSNIVIKVNSVSTKINIAAPLLTFSDYEIDIYDSEVIESPTRQAAMQSINIDSETVFRIEGGIAYTLPRKIVNAALATVEDIDVSKHFNSIKLKGGWNIKLVNSNLIIIPEGGIELLSRQECTFVDRVPQLQTQITQVQLPNGEYELNVSHTGIPPITPPRTTDDPGFASLYITQSIFDKICKAIGRDFNYNDSRGGGISFKMSTSVSFRCKKIRIDFPPYPDPRGTADLTYQISSNIRLYGKVPCVGKVLIGTASVKGLPTSIKLKVGFDLKNSTIGMYSTLESMGQSTMKVKARVFGRWLGSLGIVTSWVTDELDRIIARNIKQKLKDKFTSVIKSTINKNSYQVIDLDPLDNLLPELYEGNSISVAGDTESLLVGVSFNKG
ncbi:hypothetical protein [Olleya marilimosa]|uniref:hypothetical protein n=1 Tax=Olleya marilimosa TaxID=272164 RepID=UPI0004812A4F|nr:hypothetical protein [Olleya marilimosa]